MSVFTTFANWLMGVVGKMLNQSVIKDVLHMDVSVSNEMVSALRLWTAMYENRAPWLGKDVLSMNLPATIASEIARATTIEMKQEITGSSRATFLQEQFVPVMAKLRQFTEYGVAKGGLVFKPYVYKGRINVDFVQADQFFPVEFDVNGNITSCVFSDQRAIGNKFFTRLEVHSMDGDKCQIVNRAFKSEDRDTLGREIQLTEVPVWADIEPEATIEGVEKPLFSYFRYPVANTIDPSSPLGASCYSRAVSLIEQADRMWSDLLWEFESGQRALFVDVLAFGKDKDGKPVLPNKRLYRAIESGSTEGEFFQEWTPDLREQNILAGLDAILKKVEFSIGLAYGTISDPNSVEKTATEIVSSKQRSYATITDTQKALQRALEDLIAAMDIWATLEKLAPKGKYQTKFEFDDSVVVDKETQFASDMRLVTAAIMSKIEFRMRNLGEDEATAKKKLAEVKAEQQEQIELEAANNDGAPFA